MLCKEPWSRRSPSAWAGFLIDRPVVDTATTTPAGGLPIFFNLLESHCGNEFAFGEPWDDNSFIHSPPIRHDKVFRQMSAVLNVQCPLMMLLFQQREQRPSQLLLVLVIGRLLLPVAFCTLSRVESWHRQTPWCEYYNNIVGKTLSPAMIVSL